MFLTKVGAGGYLDKLVGYYPFNSNSLDFSGKNHNGTIVGSPTFSTGKVGNAIDFINDTNANYVDIPHTTDFNFSDATHDYPFSMCMWVKFHEFSSLGNWLINKRGGTSATDEWQLMYYENRLWFSKFQFNNQGIYQTIQTSMSPFSLNTWYHIAYTDSGNNAVGSGKLYINGIENVELNANVGAYTKLNYGNSISRFGAFSWVFVGSIKHKGLIDESYIWKDRCLTPSEVLDIYNKGILGQILI